MSRTKDVYEDLKVYVNDIDTIIKDFEQMELLGLVPKNSLKEKIEVFTIVKEKLERILDGRGL